MGTSSSRRRRSRRSGRQAIERGRANNPPERSSKPRRDRRRQPEKPVADNGRIAEPADRTLPPARPEATVQASEWTQVDTPLKLIAYVLATDDPKKRWRRFMIVLLVFLGTIILVAGAAVATMWLAPPDSLLARLLFTAVGIVGTGLGVAGTHVARRRSRNRTPGLSLEQEN